MNSAAVFLLGVLHALVVTMASPMVSRSDVLSVASAEQLYEFAQWSALNARAPEETVRVPLRASTSMLLRTTAPLPFGRANALPIDVVTLESFTLSDFATEREHATDIHRLASRGSVLPYFPTAPPQSA